MPPFKASESLLLGFVRDLNDAEEFLLKISCKTTGKALSIPIEDVDQIEHVEGTL